MNSKFQIGSHEQPIYRSYTQRYMGWRQLAWYYATALLFFVCLYRGFVSFFLLLVLLSRALRYWLLLSQNEKALNRFFPHLGIDFYGTEFAFHLSAMIFGLKHAMIFSLTHAVILA